MPQKPQRQTDHYQELLDDLNFEVRTIRDNHLVHLADNVSELKSDLKETKEEFRSGFTKLDERIFQLMLLAIGGLAATLLGIFFA